MRPTGNRLGPGPDVRAPVHQPLAHRGLPQSLEDRPESQKITVTNRRPTLGGRGPAQRGGPGLMNLRKKSRMEPDLPAEAAGLTNTELRVLRHSPAPGHGVRCVPGLGRTPGP